MSTPETCPKCKKSFKGSPIPPEQQKAFGGASHFSTVIGGYSTSTDRTVSWHCPFCGHNWPRI